MLLGLDGSAYSAAAMALGIRWAQHCSATLVGLGIVDEPTICHPEAVPLGGSYYKHERDARRLEEAHQKVAGFLADFATACETAHIVYTVSQEVGTPSERLLRATPRYDVVLFGQQTYFHFETQEAPCDTLEQVLKHGPRPVVAVPEQPVTGSTAVIAYDGSLQAARALQTFQSLGLYDVYELHVVSVHHDQPTATQQVEEACAFLGFHKITAIPHPVMSSAAPSEVLLEYVKTHPGLLVMGAYGGSAFVEFFLGSATRTLLTESPVPVFLSH
jgi:nucleotide-binding universal stress UspA family protein